MVPLTYDHTALRDALEQVNRSWAGYGGTNFEQVLRRAMDTFARSAPDGANALVILSDGEDTVDSSIGVAQEAKKHDLLVITVGIGTSTGAPIPDEHGENGLWEDAAGKHVISKLDMEALKRFSQATGGSFLAMNSGANLTAFARETADKLARHEESYSTGRQPRDLFGWCFSCHVDGVGFNRSGVRVESSAPPGCACCGADGVGGIRRGGGAGRETKRSVCTGDADSGGTKAGGGEPTFFSGAFGERSAFASSRAFGVGQYARSFHVR